MRRDADAADEEVYFSLCVYQGVIDILGEELRRRRNNSDGKLVDRLPEILASEPETTDRPPQRRLDFSIPESVESPSRRLEDKLRGHILSQLGRLTTDELESEIKLLRDHAAELSQQRKLILKVERLIEAEWNRRRYMDNP